MKRLSDQELIKAAILLVVACWVIGSLAGGWELHLRGYW